MTQDIKAIDRAYVERVLSAGDIDAIDELCSPDFISHVSGYPDMGRDGDKQLVAMIRAAFPDLSVTVEDQFAEGDRAVHRLKLEGTHQGELFGVPATGRHVSVSGININRIVDGKLVEAWGIIDMMGLMVQLGAAPTPA